MEMGKDSLLASLDFGTTGVRALIINREGIVKGSGECEVSILPATSGLSEQSIDAFWEAMLQAWDKALVQSQVAPSEITGLGFSHQRCTFAFSNQQFEPITNLIVWMDRRGIPFLDTIHSLIGRKEYYQITGLPIYYISSISKILWFQKENPALFDSANRIWPISNFILARFGVKDPPIDFATASFYGMMNGTTREWSHEIISALKLHLGQLPQLVPSGTVVGLLTNHEVAKRMGLPFGLPLIIGGGDQQCAALGSGMIHSGQSLINLGTATAIMSAVDRPVRDPNNIIPCVSHAAPGQWEMEGHTQASGIILQRFRDEFGDVEKIMADRNNADVYEFLCTQAEQSIPGANGLVFLPMLNGSTAPVDDPFSSGAMLGLRLSHTRADILRAIMEGICFENRWILEAMEESGAEINDVFITGGASKSTFWNQLHSDILDRSVFQVKTSNAALIGAAICAGIGVGWFQSAEEGVKRFSKVGSLFRPTERDAHYDKVYEQFLRSYKVLHKGQVFNELRDLA